jgi:hypothetical protein
VLEIAGVYLTPTSQAFRARCRQVADRLGFAVPCPWLLPASPPGLPPPRLCDQPRTCRPGRLLMFIQQGFVVPFGYVGGADGYGYLSVIATPTGGLGGPLEPRCQNERQLATPTVQGTRAVLATCADDPDESLLGGAELLRWSKGSTSVVVSALGHAKANQGLVVALADHLHLFPPRS